MNEDDKVTAAISAEESAVREKIEASERAMKELENELRSADGELLTLSNKKQQYKVLERICGSLDELKELGAADLFWNTENGSGSRTEHIEFARKNIDAFMQEMEKADARRDSVIEKIESQNQVLDFLDYDLRDAIEREDLRQSEWIAECEFREIPYHNQIMPWSRGAEEDHRFRRTLAASVLVCMLLGLMSMFVDLPIPLRSELTEVPERVAKLIREERALPPPVEVPQVLPKEIIPEPEPELAEEIPQKEVVEQVDQPIVAEVQQEDTREQVKTKGILAFRDSFASRAINRPVAQLGSQARIRDAGEEAVGRPERSMVTTSAAGSSGGINLADISRDVGGGGQAIEGVQLSRVASSIGGEGGADRPLSGGRSAGRTDEEIQIVFDRYKAALYRLYNRELRKDPTLRGQLILRLTIEPDGSVSFCQLQSTDMNAPTLAEQVVERVSSFDFGAKENIVAMTIIYPIDFLPVA